jgi:hypothetical protein
MLVLKCCLVTVGAVERETLQAITPPFKLGLLDSIGSCLGFEPAALRVRCSSWRPGTFLHLDFVHGGEQLFNNVVLTFPYFRLNFPETID